MFKKSEMVYYWTGINNEYIIDSGSELLLGYTGCPINELQCFQIKFTKHGKTDQIDYFL